MENNSSEAKNADQHPIAARLLKPAFRRGFPVRPGGQKRFTIKAV